MMSFSFSLIDTYWKISYLQQKKNQRKQIDLVKYLGSNTHIHTYRSIFTCKLLFSICLKVFFSLFLAMYHWFSWGSIDTCNCWWDFELLLLIPIFLFNGRSQNSVAWWSLYASLDDISEEQTMIAIDIGRMIREHIITITIMMMTMTDR
jgi:hypothetical protein